MKRWHWVALWTIMALAYGSYGALLIVEVFIINR